jgi:hypothetical protein
MVYAGVLPFADVTDAKGNIERLYLLGLENAEEHFDHDLWADFGGGAHNPSDLLRSAAEEFYEESMGSFGTADHIAKRLTESGTRVDLPNKAGAAFLLRIPYDASLPQMWNGIWNYFQKCAKQRDGKFLIASCPEGFFEKKRIGWFSANDILKGPAIRPIFRKSFIHILQNNASIETVKKKDTKLKRLAKAKPKAKPKLKAKPKANIKKR